MFGDDNEAKRIAHQAFNRHYRKYFGKALPFEPKVRDMLEGLRGLGIFWRAKGRRSGLHIDVRGEAAIHDRYTRPNELRQGDAGQGLCVLLGQRTGQADR